MKRITLFCGHYGSGKTNVAVQVALQAAAEYPRVAIADLDIVNPYFRTKDSMADLAHAGVRLICSSYANSNLDIPALPQEMYAITDDRDLRVVVDVGGDDRGALALGRLAPAIRRENDYEMLAVINCYRPLTRTAASTVAVLREIEAACGIAFTGLVNNSNLGGDTTPADVLASLAYERAVAAAMQLPVRFVSVRGDLAPALADDIPHLLPLRLQKKITDGPFAP